jgi:hypothetical protein
MPTSLPLGTVFQNCCLNNTLGFISSHGDEKCFTYCNYTTPYDYEEEYKQLETFYTCFDAGRVKLNYTASNGMECFGAKTYYGEAKNESRKNRGSVKSIIMFCGVGFLMTFVV